MSRYLVLGLIIIGILSCDDIVEVKDISGDTVVLIAPVDASILAATTPTFSWQSLEDAESYHFQLATPSFNSALQIVEDTTLTSLNYTSVILPSDSYEWRVRGENSAYVTAYTTHSFIIENDISALIVALLSPADASVLTNPDVVLSWQAVEGATSYNIQIATPNFANAFDIVEDTNITTTNFDINLTANTYEWRVKANNTHFETEYTASTFTIQ